VLAIDDYIRLLVLLK